MKLPSFTISPTSWPFSQVHTRRHGLNVAVQYSMGIYKQDLYALCMHNYESRWGRDNYKPYGSNQAYGMSGMDF